MQLHEPSMINRLAKSLAPALARIVCSRLLYRPMRVGDAYLNFLMGKGAGTGWGIECEVAAAVDSISSAEPIVFDIGANVGDWSAHLLHACPQAKVLMFEPSPTCQEKIRKKALPNSTLIPCAVGERVGSATLNFSSSTDGGASLHLRRDSYFQANQYQAIEVQVTTVDEVMQEHGIEFVDFIKMDIEGHEFSALKGASAALAAKRIGALAFEFGSGNINSRVFFHDIWDLLSGHGYSLWRMAPGKVLIPIRDYYEDLEYFRGVTNYIAKLPRQRTPGAHETR